VDRNAKRAGGQLLTADYDTKFMMMVDHDSGLL
jgi:hypothetical protein